MIADLYCIKLYNQTECNQGNTNDYFENNIYHLPCNYNITDIYQMICHDK